MSTASLIRGYEVVIVKQRLQVAFLATGAAVLATLGAAGALLVTAEGAWAATPPPITVRSTVGAGDSSVAGFILADVAGGSPADCLASAVSHGSAAASLPGTTLPTPADRLFAFRVLTYEVAREMALARVLRTVPAWRDLSTDQARSALGSAGTHLQAQVARGLLLLAAETYAWLVLLLGYWQTSWPLHRPPAQLPADPAQWPSVDLMIPTYNEAENIEWIVGRVRAATPQDQATIAIPDAVELGPDGDVLPSSSDGFVVPDCSVCGGMLKPDIVFFGESLPPAMDGAMEAAKECDVVLVAGTSLAVLTGLWVVRQAMARGAELVVVNRGRTAVDEIAGLRIEGGTSKVLGAVADALLAR